MQSNDTCGRKSDGCGFKKTGAVSLARVFKNLSLKWAILMVINSLNLDSIKIYQDQTLKHKGSLSVVHKTILDIFKAGNDYRT